MESEHNDLNGNKVYSDEVPPDRKKLYPERDNRHHEYIKG